MSKICNRKSKTQDVSTSKVFVSQGDLQGRNVPGFTLPVAYFAHIIDFRSYVDATMSLYSNIQMCIRNVLVVHESIHPLACYRA